MFRKAYGETMRPVQVVYCSLEEAPAYQLWSATPL